MLTDRSLLKYVRNGRQEPDFDGNCPQGFSQQPQVFIVFGFDTMNVGRNIITQFVVVSI